MAILAECPIRHNKQSKKNKTCKCGEGSINGSAFSYFHSPAATNLVNTWSTNCNKHLCI